MPEKPDSPDHPLWPETPEAPDWPETPEAPDWPDQPEIPERLLKPETPELPLSPELPDEPDQAEIPETPELPLSPEYPEMLLSPEKPEIPLCPLCPDVPDQPEVPLRPETPLHPDMPENIFPGIHDGMVVFPPCICRDIVLVIRHKLLSICATIIKLMRVGVLDAIYWKLHSAYLRNRREDAAYLLELLDHEVGVAGAKSLLDEVGEIHFARAKAMKKAIRDGTWSRIGAGYSSQDATGHERAERSGREDKFHRWLYSRPGREAMCSCLGAGHRSGVVHEVDMEEFGRCDFVVRDGRRWFVVEVKMGNAPSSVISQIDKYRMAAELDMCKRTHDEVVGAVLAESFSPYVTAELSRSGVLMIQHDGESLLRRIDHV